MAAPKYCRQCYASWQVASVLNPSLRSSSTLSSREKREREQEHDSSVSSTDNQKSPGYNSNAQMRFPWRKGEEDQDESEEGGDQAMDHDQECRVRHKSHQLPLPPQYVSAKVLSKAMPKYSRNHNNFNRHGGQPAPIPFYTNPAAPINHPRNPDDQSSPSPRPPEYPSGRETPRSGVVEFPAGFQSKPRSPIHQLQATSGMASPASFADQQMSRRLKPLGTAKPSPGAPVISSAPTEMRGGGGGITQESAAPGGVRSPRRRCASVAPMLPTQPVAPDVATPAHATLLRSKLASLAQHRGGDVGNGADQVSAAPMGVPPVALPPTPPLGHRERRVRNPHPPEPTLETYERASPDTHATNAVWNERRDTSRERTNPRHSILITN